MLLKLLLNSLFFLSKKVYIAINQIKINFILKKIFIFFIFLLFSFSAQAKVKSKDISFPKHFYVEQIETCPYFLGSDKFSSEITKERIKSLLNLDWMSEWAKGNSRSVNHENLSKPMKLFSIATHNAVGENNKESINEAKKIIVELAKKDFLFNTISRKELKEKPRCWKDGNPEAPCWYHAYEFARDSFANLMIIALYFKEDLNEEEFKIVNKYVEKMYKKFIQPHQFIVDDKGFYAMGNGGIPNLVYSNWTNDKKLAAKEFNFRFKNIEKVFYEDGYINNNSFRGYRGLWYHSYGLNSALGYLYLAKLWGAKIPETVMKKVTKAAEVLNLGIKDYEKFSSRKYDGDQLNNSYKKKNARMHTHQDALAIDTLMEMVVSVTLEDDRRYLELRKERGMDALVGFNANCIK